MERDARRHFFRAAECAFALCLPATAGSRRTFPSRVTIFALSGTDTFLTPLRSTSSSSCLHVRKCDEALMRRATENCRKLEALLAEEGVRLVESLRGED